MKKNKTPSEFNYTKSKEEFQLLRERGAFEDENVGFFDVEFSLKEGNKKSEMRVCERSDSNLNR
jgi:hypothetical protein